VNAGPAARWDLGRRRLYLCSPDRPDLELFIERCIAGGVDIVQLRDKRLTDSEVVECAARVQRVCADRGIPFILNDRPDLAAAIGADGVHIGQEDMAPDRARRLMGADAVVGLSTHRVEDLDGAVHAPVDYISAGPVTPTPTKPGRAGTGLGYVSEAASRASCPVWITGGVDPTTVVGMAEAGARHFVVVRWLTEATEPEARARMLRRAIDRAIDQAIEDAVGRVEPDAGP
jgi:thiamine-phosphate pyrophosphorylase